MLLLSRFSLRFRLALLFFLVALLSFLWVAAVPLDLRHYGNWFPDEGDHLSVARYWAHFGQPPPYEPPYMTSSHPPLFYLLAGLVLRLGGENLLLVRLLCALLGLGTTLAAWNAARLLAGREAGLLSAAVIGLVPMRLALSAGASNENLATLIAALALWTLAKIARHGITPPRLLALAACLTLGFGVKATCLGLFLAALPVLVGRLGGARALGFLALCGAGLLGLWSPWLLWNRAHYGDWLKEKAAHAYWDERAPGFLRVHAATQMSFLRYFFGVSSTGFRSFWAIFAGMSRPLPLALYLPLLLWSGAGIREALRRRRPKRALRRWWLGALLYGVFLLGVFVSYNWFWFSAQGRYLYGALIPVGVLLARGYLRAFRPHVRPWAGWGLTLALVLLNIACLALYPPWR